MTNEQINRAVAEELIGTLCWTDQSGDGYGHREDCPCNGTGLIELDFCTDHNAAAEIRKAIKPEERVTFTSWLLRVVVPDDRRSNYDFTPFDVINATPRQQAEAFLRMRGKWVDGE